MAALAVVEVRFPERALAVVTGHAGLRSRVWEMLRREGRADLTPLRQPTAPDCVTALTIQTLAGSVVRVAESDVKRSGRG
jgi:hypothetical protein